MQKELNPKLLCLLPAPQSSPDNSRSAINNSLTLIDHNNTMVFFPSTSENDEKPGNTLVSSDILIFENVHRRNIFLKKLKKAYGIEFKEDFGTPQNPSFTSRKAILFGLAGEKYFLKMKPDYSLSEPQKTASALMQDFLSKRLSYVPRIIKTKDGSSFYVKIGGKTFFLTPYIEGNYFFGTPEQSFACARALGEIHRSLLDFSFPEGESTPLDSTEETLKFIKMVAELSFNNQELKRDVLQKMRKLCDKFASTNQGKISWLHGDFSPYNMVFGNQGDVRAVNDFDNVAFGLLARDIGECLLTHCGVNYAANTSSLKPPIRIIFDFNRMKEMLKIYLTYNPLNKNDFIDLPNQIVLVWLELLSLGLLRGDFLLNDVLIALSHCQEIYELTLSIYNDI